MDEEILQVYLEESREHLASIENDLLAVEEAGADFDEKTVNEVFRAVHSIKGGASFMELNQVKELSHKMENVLGMIRSRDMAPSPEVINILLLAFDKLKELINNIELSETVDISEHVGNLNRLTSPPKEAVQGCETRIDIRLPNGQLAFQIAQLELEQARAEWKNLYLIEYDLKAPRYHGKMVLDAALESMQEDGVILRSRLDISAAGTIDRPGERLPFFVLLATVIEPDFIEKFLDVDESCVHLLMDQTKLATSPEKDITKLKPEAEDISTCFESAETNKTAVLPMLQQRPDILKTYSRPEGQKKNEIPEPHQSDTSLRVHVSLLDTLMTLAGEMVLSRNQLLRAVSSGDQRFLEIASQRINFITSELQEAIMITRMQPIGNTFSKFPRVVRDLARGLNKEIQLSLEGKDVELDKTIIEGLSDPLTHLVRNAVDHGIEAPEVRSKLGKDPVGHVCLKAFHEAGQVNIEISDDGGGLDGNKLAHAALAKGIITEEQARTMPDKEKIELIFLPGFSTADKVSEVSGRGVGMDVVKTNLDRLGGQIQVESEADRGTTIRIRLPLTLAIIPSLIFSIGKERFAVPQVNLDELIRIPANQVKDRIERVGDAEVVRVRETLLPILSLAKVLGIERTYLDVNDGVGKPDRRESIADRRSNKTAWSASTKRAGESVVASRYQESGSPNIGSYDDRTGRRYCAASAVNILVVSAGSLRYGLVVDELHDSEEIVVKPLGRHLKNCRGYAGATILGDGRVALILDIASITRKVGLATLEGMNRVAEITREAARKAKLQDLQSLLIFRNDPAEQFAVPMEMVARLEQIKASEIEGIGGRKSIQYRGDTLPVFAIGDVAEVKPLPDREDLLVIVFVVSGREVGLLAVPPIDSMSIPARFDHVTFRQPGIMGSAIIRGYTTLMVDVHELTKILNPAWFEDQPKVQSQPGRKPTILLAEDSDFFRAQVKSFIEEEGYKVIAASDGSKAWRLLEDYGDEIALVITDIEMPVMNGYELTRKIRKDKRFSHLPVIAVTSLAGEDDISRGKDAGINDYQIKLDKEQLVESVCQLLKAS